RLSDTSPEAQRVRDDIHRAMPLWRKWQLLDDLHRLGRSLHAAGVPFRNPLAMKAEIRDDWIGSRVGLPTSASSASRRTGSTRLISSIGPTRSASPTSWRARVEAVS